MSRPTFDRRIACVAVLSLLLVGVGVGWSIASPLGASPDDDFHMSSIWCSGTAPSNQCEVLGPIADTGQESVRVPNAISSERVACYAFKGAESAECLQAFDDEEPAVARANAGAYPGGYYALLGFLVTDRPAQSVLTMRLASWLLCFGIIAVPMGLARARVRAFFTLGVLATSVPLMVFVFASVNPSAPTIAGTVACACSLVNWSEPRTRRRDWLAFALAIVAAAVALAARPDAAVWLAVAVLMVSVLQLQAMRRAPVRLVLPGVLLVMCAVMALRFSRFSAGFEQDALPRPFGTVVFRNVTDLPLLWFGSLGSTALGWFDTPMPALCWGGMITLFGALVFTGIRRVDREKGASLAIGLVALTVVPIYFLAQGGNVVPEAVQPRYVLPLLPIVLSVVMWRRSGDRDRLLSRSQLVVVGVVLSLAHTAALHTNLRRYVRGLAEDGFGLNGDIEWWWRAGWPSPMLVWVVASLCFTGAIGILLAMSACWLSDEASSGCGGRSEPRLGTEAETLEEAAVPGRTGQPSADWVEAGG